MTGRSRESSRRPDVQGLRAVAVLLVMSFHAGLPVPGGFTGVDVFFVISGFVIAASIVRDTQSDAGFSLRGFYARRVRRLLPALATLVGIVCVASVVLQSPAIAHRTVRTGVAAVASVANIEVARTTGGYFDEPATTNPLLHTWSLSVEEQFYLVLPLLLILGLRLGRGRRHPLLPAAVLLALVGSASFALAHHWVLQIGPPDRPAMAQTAFYSAATRAWEFVAGVLLALAVAGGASPGRRGGGICGIAGIGLLTAAFARLDASSGVPSTPALLPVLGSLGILAAGCSPSWSPVSRLLAWAPLVAIGDVSYSLYLWHWPAVVLAHIAAPESLVVAIGAVALSALPAVLSYRWVEQPVRRRSVLGAWSAPRLVAALAGTAVLLAAVPAVASERSQSAATRAFTTQTTSSHTDHRLGCDVPPSDAHPPARRCAIGPDTAGTVYLVGDSQAGMWSEAVLGAAAALHWRTVIATQHACPWIVPDGVRHCPDLASSLHWLAEQPPGVVVLAVESDSYVDNEVLDLGTTGRAQRAAAWELALAATVRPLLAAGHRVVIVHPAPRFWTWRPGTCNGPLVRRSPHDCGQRIRRSDAQAWRAAAMGAERSVGLLPGVSTVDPFDAMCDAQVCRTNLGNRWLARDADHVTVELSTSLAPAFAAAIGRISSGPTG